MPPRSRQQGKKPVQNVPLPDIKDNDMTNDQQGAPEQPDTAQNTPENATGAPESAVQTFVAGSDSDGIEGQQSPLAAPDRKFPPSTYETKYTGQGNAEPKGRILRGEEPFSFEGERVGEFVVCTEDVYREVFYAGTKRPSYVVVARRGQQFHGKGMINLTETEMQAG